MKMIPQNPHAGSRSLLSVICCLGGSYVRFLAILVDRVNWGRGECSVTLVSPARGGVEPRKGLLGGPFKMLPKIVKGGSAIKLLRRLPLELELGQIIHVGKKQGMPLNWAIIVAPNLLQEKLHRRNERAVWSEEEE